MATPRVLVYVLRRDLRLADNPIFHEITRLAQDPKRTFTHVLPLYVFSAEQIEVSGFLTPQRHSPFPEARSEIGGFWRCGPHRAQFLAECVWDLKTDLTRIGSSLAIRVGMVGQVVKDLLEEYDEHGGGEVVSVWMTSEEGEEEKKEEEHVERVVKAEDKEFRLWSDEKYFIDDRDLPFDDPSDLPDVFTTYRKQVEPLRDGPRPVLPTPSKLPPVPPYVPRQSPPFSEPKTLEATISALLEPLERSPIVPNPPAYPHPTKSGHPFHGGASHAHERLHHLLVSGAATSYQDTRNGLLGLDYSTKLSAWLSHGCITARQIHSELLVFEDGEDDDNYQGSPGYGGGENAGTAAIRFELLWRDYMRLCTRKFGPRLFNVTGFRNDSPYPWKSPARPFRLDAASFTSSDETTRTLARFLSGRTGTSLIDASQLELLHTGYTSNRARQNVASFLSKHLHLDWRIGAEWYECLLIDYDVNSNWGNWQYVSGVGNDPRVVNTSSGAHTASPGSSEPASSPTSSTTSPSATSSSTTASSSNSPSHPATLKGRIFNPIKQALDYDPRGEYIKAWIPKLRDATDLLAIYQPWKLSAEEKRKLRLDNKGIDWVDSPLRKIEFELDLKSRGKRRSIVSVPAGNASGGSGNAGGNGCGASSNTTSNTSTGGSKDSNGETSHRHHYRDKSRGSSSSNSGSGSASSSSSTNNVRGGSSGGGGGGGGGGTPVRPRHRRGGSISAGSGMAAGNGNGIGMGREGRYSKGRGGGGLVAR